MFLSGRPVFTINLSEKLREPGGEGGGPRPSGNFQARRTVGSLSPGLASRSSGLGWN